MKKALLISVIIFTSILFSHAQFRIGIVGGLHQSTVMETNNLSGWDSIKGNYSGRTGGHFGFIADLPFSQKSLLSFQPGIIYYTKGRKYFQSFDTSKGPYYRLPSDTSIKLRIINKSGKQFINYIDVPLNLILKFGKKIKFIVGGGPYLSFFYSGQENSHIITKNGIADLHENEDLPVGEKPGQYKVFNYGVNGLVGFESGRVTLTANYSRGLNDFYNAANYTGTFKHQVIGATLGIFIGKPVEFTTEIKDKDSDGVIDKLDKCPEEAGLAKFDGCPDKDNDGIADKDDQCPLQAGPVANKGCPYPDTDNDGVIDRDDKCPNEAGPVSNNGCPVLDSDKDGVPDKDDKCPEVAGYGRYEGCPIPDSDDDGVNNEEDKCPDVKGVKENNGCPATEIKKEIIEKVNYAARKIQFKFNSAELQQASFKILDEVVKILKEDGALKLSIEGHTSNDGSLEANMKLSNARANNVKNYLQTQGIDASRLTAQGFGPSKPINTGTNEAAKAQNRRVEMKLSN